MTKRTTTAVIATLTVLAALLRLPGLDSGLWFDEIVTLVESVRLPFRELVAVFPGNNNHPFYSLLAHLSVSTLGEHPWTLRLPAFIFGVASIPALYRLGAAVTSRVESLLAALLLAVAYHAVWFSQNARGYTALLFFTLVTTLLFVRLSQRFDRKLAVAYGVLSGLGIYTHLTMAFLAGAHALVWSWQVWQALDRSERSRHIRTAGLALGAAALVSGLLYLPMAGQVYQVLNGPPESSAAVATPKWAMFEVLRGLRIGLGTVGLLIALTLASLGTMSHLRRMPFIVCLFVLPGVMTAVAMLAMGAPIRPRFFFSLLGFGLLMLVRGAIESERFVRRHVGYRAPRTEICGVLVVALIAVMSAYSLRNNYRYPKQDFDGALQFIESHRHGSEPVGTSGLAIYPYEHYYRKAWTALEKAEQFDRLRASPARAWVVYSFPEYMDPALVEALERYCTPQHIFPGTLGGGAVIVCTTMRRSG